MAQTIDKMAAAMAEKAKESGVPQQATFELGTFGPNACKFVVFVTVAEVREPLVRIVRPAVN